MLVGSTFYLIAPVIWWLDAAVAMILALLFLKDAIEMIKYSISPDFNGGCCCSKNTTNPNTK